MNGNNNHRLNFLEINSTCIISNFRWTHFYRHLSIGLRACYLKCSNIRVLLFVRRYNLEIGFHGNRVYNSK